MRALVLIFAAVCVSSAPLEAGYGVPLAPVVSISHQLVRIPPLAGPVSALQPVAAPFSVSLPTGVAALGAAAAVFAPAQAAFAPAQATFAPALATFAPALAVPLEAPSSQFHAQDEFGQFSFGYQNINSARTESKDAFGVTHGSYQYVDANGVLQTVNYVADPVNGFRVAATNLPVAPANPVVSLPAAPVPVEETPEVAAARAEHLAAVEAAKVEASSEEKRRKREADPITGDYEIPLAPVITQSMSTVKTQLPVLHTPAPLIHHLPAAVHPAPLAHSVSLGHSVALPASLPVFSSPFLAQAHAAAPFLPFSPALQPAIPLRSDGAFAAAHIPVASPLTVNTALALPINVPSSQFHAQDEFGQFSFGYQNINSARTESKDAFGVTHGSYQYVDANGVLQTVNYVADPVNGFRVAATNLPVAPANPVVSLPAAPVPVEETPEVAAARAEHLAAVEAAKTVSEE